MNCQRLTTIGRRKDKNIKMKEMKDNEQDSEHIKTTFKELLTSKGRGGGWGLGGGG